MYNPGDIGKDSGALTSIVARSRRNRERTRNGRRGEPGGREVANLDDSSIVACFGAPTRRRSPKTRESPARQARSFADQADFLREPYALNLDVFRERGL